MKSVVSTRRMCFVDVARGRKGVATVMLARNLVMSRATTVGAPLLSLLGAVAMKHPELVCCIVLPLLFGGGLIFNGLQMYQGRHKL